MTYRVETTPIAQQQLLGLPRTGQLAYLDLRDRLADDPWAGVPWVEQTQSAMREMAFGDQGEGIATYVIVGRDDRVVVVKLLWLS